MVSKLVCTLESLGELQKELVIPLIWDVAWPLEFLKDPPMILMCRHVERITDLGNKISGNR